MLSTTIALAYLVLRINLKDCNVHFVYILPFDSSAHDKSHGCLI